MFLLLSYFLLFFTVNRKDEDYEATRLHFDNLVLRYGKPVIILNLIKVCSLVVALQRFLLFVKYEK